MPIVGTAGHVDHGKSTLVEALTGRDPDRWAEEKARGLTIDLGFAWTRLDDTTDVGFVDVPGHEKFIKNMLAGVGALDVALFVVAADEGWMPQTEEHLAVLDLLDVRHGVIALTRADLVDGDLIELATLDVDDHTAGTTLEHWPVIPVSAVTGEGLPELRAAVLETLQAAGPSRDTGRPRLWVDRSFVVGGAGLVVTGTLAGGAIHRDTELAIWPGGRRARVRAIQSHKADVAAAQPGTRTALNLSGIDPEDVARGALLAAPGQVAPSSKILVDLRAVRSLDDAITDRGAYHLHAGTGAWPVALRVVGQTSIEDRGVALLELPLDLGFEMGDRVIVREVGRKAVVAGGRVLDPAPGGKLSAIARTVEALRAALDGSPSDRADALLEIRGTERLAVLAAHAAGGAPSNAIQAGVVAASSRAISAIVTEAVERVERYHEDNPLRPGLPKAELASTLGIEPDLMAAAIATSETLTDGGAVIHSTGFTGGWGPQQEAEWKAAETLLRDDGLGVRRATQLGLNDETFHALLRNDRLVRVADDLVYLPEQIDEITARLAGLSDGFTVADFRDALGLSRRQAVPLLEWLDSGGWTARRGDVRIVRRRPEPESSDAPTP